MTAVQVLVLVLGVATPALALILFKVREHLTAARKDAARLKAEKAELLGKLEATRAELNSSRTQVLELGRVRLELTQARDLSQQLQQRLADAEAKLGGISNVEAERARLVAEEQTLRAQIHAKRSQWEAQYAAATEELGRLQREVGALTEHAELQTFGLYKAHYDFGVSEIYKEELEDVRARQKEMVKAKTAATSTRKWVVDGSAAKGQQMLERQLKLMLRAFNGECDAAVAKVRFNNITALETRLQKSFEAVNQLGQSNECAISEGYLALKEAELRLTHEYAEKLQEEREEQKLIREQMREEEQVRREREEQQREAELEEQRVAAALEKARAQLLGAAQRDQERFQRKGRQSRSAAGGSARPDGARGLSGPAYARGTRVHHLQRGLLRIECLQGGHDSTPGP